MNVGRESIPFSSVLLCEAFNLAMIHEKTKSLILDLCVPSVEIADHVRKKLREQLPSVAWLSCPGWLVLRDRMKIVTQ